MKIKTDILFNLIENLSKKDRIFFIKKLDLNNHKRAIILFEEMLKLQDSKERKENFEKILKTKIPKDVLKYYRINKSLLKKELILHIHLQEVKKEVDYQIRQEINIGKTLLRLYFIKEGFEYIEKAKQKAIKEECFEEVLYALETLRNHSLAQHISFEIADKLNKEITHYQNIKSNYYDLKALRHLIIASENGQGVLSEKLKTIMNNVLLKSEDNALSYKAKNCYFLCWIDYYLSIREYEKMEKIISQALIVAKVANSQSDEFFNFIFSIYEAQSFVLTRNKKYVKGLHVLNEMESLKTNKNTNKHAYIDLIVSVERLSIYGQLKHKKFDSHLDEFLKIMPKYDIRSKSNIFFLMMAHSAASFKNYKKTCIIFKKFFAFFVKNYEDLNPTYSLYYESFLYYFISAFKLYNKETFIFINEKIFNKKNEKYFKEGAPFHYVTELYNVFLKAFGLDFFENKFIEEYFKIWSIKPDIIKTKKYVLIEILGSEYNEAVEIVASKYENRNKKLGKVS